MLALINFFFQRSFLDHLLHAANGGSGGNSPNQLVVAAAAVGSSDSTKVARTTVDDDALAGADAAIGVRTTIVDGVAARARRSTLGGAPEGRVRRFDCVFSNLSYLPFFRKILWKRSIFPGELAFSAHLL